MSAIERLTITMPAEMAATLRRTVEGGEYASTSEIVREALRDWTRSQATNQAKLAWLRAAVAEGDEGDGIPAEDVYTELDQLIEERLAAKA